MVVGGGLLNVRTLACDGRLLRVVAGGGEGTGKFRATNEIWLREDGLVGAWDGWPSPPPPYLLLSKTIPVTLPA